MKTPIKCCIGTTAVILCRFHSIKPLYRYRWKGQAENNSRPEGWSIRAAWRRSGIMAVAWIQQKSCGLAVLEKSSARSD